MKLYIPFNSYSPDFADILRPNAEVSSRQGLAVCENLLYAHGVYNKFPAIADMTSDTIHYEPVYIYQRIWSDLTNKTFLCTENDIYRFDGTNLTRLAHSVSGNDYFATPDTDTWDIDYYGDTLYITNNEKQLVKLADSSDTTYEDVTEAPSKCKSIQVFENHLFCLNTYESAVRYESRLRRSALGDPDDFTVDPDTGAGYQDLPSYGDEGMAVRRLGDSLAVYFTNSIYIVRSVGPPLWFSSYKVTDEIGLLATNAVAQIDNSTHIFIPYKRDDLYMLTPEGIRPLGLGFRKTVFGGMDIENQRITHMVDYTNKVVFFMFKSSGALTPDQILAYNYEFGRASIIDLSKRISYNGYTFYCIGSARTPDVTWDDLDDYYSVWNDAEDTTFDSSVWKGGGYLRSVAYYTGSAYKMGSFLSQVLPASIETKEYYFDKIVTLTSITPYIKKLNNSASFNLTIYAKYDQGDTYRTITRSGLNVKDEWKMLVSGRYFKIRIDIEIKNNVYNIHSGFEGLDVYFKVAGIGDR